MYFLFIQLGLSLYEKRGWSVPVEMCPISLELYCCDVDLITPYCTASQFMIMLFCSPSFPHPRLSALENPEEISDFDGIYWLALSVYAGAAWFTEFHGPNLNSQLYLAFLRWITLTYFHDPLNFCVFY